MHVSNQEEDKESLISFRIELGAVCSIYDSNDMICNLETATFSRAFIVNRSSTRSLQVDHHSKPLYVLLSGGKLKSKSRCNGIKYLSMT
jgi:hypothetical protein